ncbi:MAG: cell division protein FtsQ/DivIB [Gemmatimonadales bacterium]
MSRRILLLVAVGVVALAFVGLPMLGRKLRFFRIREVEVIGTRYLDEFDVVRRLGLRQDASIFDRLGPVRTAARAIPGVLAATVERRFPGALRVTIHEATPVAMVQLNDRLALVDDRGRVLPFDPVRAPASLPIAGRDSSTAELLGRLMRIDPAGYDSVQVARLDHGDVVLESGLQRVRLRPEADAGILRGVMTVRRYLAGRGIRWQEIDARYRQRLFVRKAVP